MLAKLHARGHRVLIFSQMTMMLDVLEESAQSLSPSPEPTARGNLPIPASKNKIF